jgi:hypothetical protein
MDRETAITRALGAFWGEIETIYPQNFYEGLSAETFSRLREAATAAATERVDVQERNEMARAPKGYFPGEFHVGQGIAHRDTRYKATGEYREPLRGEYFLSGAIVQAYRASNDLPSKYWIAVPVAMVACPCCKGEGRTEKR